MRSSIPIPRIFRAMVLGLCYVSLSLRAQNVAKVEYFIDTDPGFGKGTNVAITPGQDVTASWAINVNSLSAGFHTLFVRSLVVPYQAQENGSPVRKGGWSLTNVRTFYKETFPTSTTTLTNVTKGEYFIDTDPGFGKGTNIPFTAGTNLTNIPLTFDITSLSTGFHRVYTRFRDANGKWGLTNNRTFYKENLTSNSPTLPNITKAEYFIDTDPGFGKGVNIPVSPAADLTSVPFAFDITSLASGFHNVYVRFRDARGSWSLTRVRNFYKESLTANGSVLPNVVKGEYFIDTDPGFGKGVNIPFTAGGNVNNIGFAVNITSLSSGFHKLYTRFRDANGGWGLTNVRAFYKETALASDPAAKVVKVEYFVDVDPGFGKGKPVAVTPATDLNNVTFEVDMTGLAVGDHTLYVRAQDDKKGWGLTNRSTFKVDVSSVPSLTVTAAASQSAICAGSSVALSVTATGGTTPYSYTWATPAGATLSATNAASVTATATSSGVNTFTVTVAGPGGTPRSSKTVNVTVNALPVVNIAANPGLNITQGQSTTLTASGAQTYRWSTGATTAQIAVTPQQTTIYSVTGTSPTGCTNVAAAQVNVTPAVLTLTAQASSSSICVNSNAGLSVGVTGGTAPYSYTWVAPAGATLSATNTSSISTTATTAGVKTFTVTVAGAGGNPRSTTTVNVTVNPLPSVSIAASPGLTITQGQSATLTASGAATYVWSTGAATASIVASTPGTYSVTGTSSAGCSATASAALNVTAAPVLILTTQATPSTVCVGGSAGLSVVVSGGTAPYSYTWVAPASVTLSGTSTSAVTATATTSGLKTFTVTVAGAGGTPRNSTTVDVTVNPLPTLGIAGNLTICAGNSTTLTASGASTYRWTNGATTATLVVNPQQTTVYSVTGVSVSGCQSVTSVTVVVNALPVVAISANPGLTITEGQSATLTASGAQTYRWATGQTTAQLVVTPQQTTIYSVSGTTSAGCSVVASAQVTVTAIPALTLTAQASQSAICVGGSTGLSVAAIGGTTPYSYTWAAPAGVTLSATNASSVTATATTSGVKTFIVTVAGPGGSPRNSTTVNVMVNPLPSATIVGNLILCTGASTTLTAGGGTSYQWSTGATTAQLVVSPQQTTVYSVTVLNASGCQSVTSVTVTVNPLPNVILTINPGSVITQGQSATLTASGAQTYRWATGATTASIIASTAGPYSVTGTSSAGCSATAIATLTVTTVPVLTLTAQANPSSICVGGSTSVSVAATGGTAPYSYTWVAPAGVTLSGTSTSAVTATATTSGLKTFTVTVAGAGGSPRNSTTVNVQVNPLPTVSVSGNLAICAGASTTLTASGGTTYQWSTGATTASLVVSPQQTTAYSVTATNASGCQSVTSVTVIVSPLPNASVAGNLTICAGTSTTLTASGGTSFVWGTGATTAQLVVNPQQTTVYSVTVTSASGCQSTTSATVTVNPQPVVSIAANPGLNITQGQSATLTASGAQSYRWNTGATTASISTSLAGTYSVTGTSPTGCSATASVSVSVTAAPVLVLTALASQSVICVGSSVGLSVQASGGTSPYSYTWAAPAGVTLSGSNTSAITATAVTSGVKTFTVTVAGAGGSPRNSATVNVTVSPLPNASITGNLTICAGASTTLTAAGGTSYLWSTGATTASLVVNPQQTTVYSVTAANASGCQSATSVTVIVSPPPVVSIAASPGLTITQGQSATLTASGAQSYHWSTGATVASIVVSTSGPYSVTGTSPRGCSATASATLSVTAAPVTSLTLTAQASPSAICVGSSASLSVQVSGGTAPYSYTWAAPVGVTLSTTNLAAVTATATTSGIKTFTVTAAGSGGNPRSSRTVNLTVNALPSVSIAATPGLVITQGQSATLTASGAQTYRWSTGATTASIVASTAGPYSVTGTSSAGCSATATATLSTTTGSSLTKLSVFHWDGNDRKSPAANNRPQPRLQLHNEGTTVVPYKEVTIRYWLTVENFAPLNYLEIYFAPVVGIPNVKMKYVPLAQPRQGAGGYIEYSFTDQAGMLAPNTNSGDIYSAIGKEDWSLFNETNDYSYANNMTYTRNNRITVYRNGVLVGGAEPPVGARVPARLAESALEVTLLGNPVTDTRFWVEVRGAAGEPLRFVLTDQQGKLVSEHRVEQAELVERQQLSTGHVGVGVLLLQVSTPTQQQTLKVLKSE